MRLNFSYCPPDVIEEGIKRLGRAIERMRAKQ
jgi:DNA-binding transcriptional MocR family regulator